VAKFPNDSVRLVPSKSGAAAGAKRQTEKWLIYCPSIASDTLLYMVTWHESYSIRSYSGHLGVNVTGRHAEGAHSTSEFVEMYEPDLVAEMTHAEIAVSKTDQWAKVISYRWDTYKETHGIK